MVVMPWKVNQLQMGSVMPAFSQYMDVVNIIRLYPSYTDGLMDRAFHSLLRFNNWYL